MMAMLRTLILLCIIFSMGNAEVRLVEKCPSGWINFGLRCYKHFSQTVNWITAEKNCQTLGANLASVDSKPENDFLLSLLPSPSTTCWIGGHDSILDGQWLWSDGNVFTGYNNWCSTEPNNMGGPENCLEINWTSNRCWNDAPCSLSTRSYVCAVDV